MHLPIGEIKWSNLLAKQNGQTYFFNFLLGSNPRKKLEKKLNEVLFLKIMKEWQGRTKWSMIFFNKNN